MNNEVWHSQIRAFYKESVYKQPTRGSKNIQKTYTTKNETPKELFDLKKFYDFKHQKLKS